MHILPGAIEEALARSLLRSVMITSNLAFKTLMESRMTAFSATSVVFSLFVSFVSILALIASIATSSICSRWLMLVISIFLLEGGS